MHSQLIKEEVDIIRTTYATATGDAFAKLGSKCEEQAKERYLATAYLTSSDHRRYGQLLNKMDNKYFRGNNQWPRTLVKARQLLIT